MHGLVPVFAGRGYCGVRFVPDDPDDPVLSGAVGVFSTALGTLSTALGVLSTALGTRLTALGTRSTALGAVSTALWLSALPDEPLALWATASAELTATNAVAIAHTLNDLMVSPLRAENMRPGAFVPFLRIGTGNRVKAGHRC
jgi:hypothetical protein